jgi:hypothetical protein
MGHFGVLFFFRVRHKKPIRIRLKYITLISVGFRKQELYIISDNFRRGFVKKRACTNLIGAGPVTM